MLLRSKKIRGAENPSNMSEEESKGGPATPDNGAASPFNAALGLILKQKPRVLNRKAIDALRLTCKATRSLIDYHAQHFIYYAESGLYLDDIASWPWRNVTQVSIRTKILHRGHKGIEQLVSLPLLKLESLWVHCQSAVPLAQHNWPMLTQLDLFIDEGREIPCPKDLEFPKWNLKILNFHVCDGAEIDFLGPLLKSSPELTSLALSAFQLRQFRRENVQSYCFGISREIRIYWDA